MFLVAICVCRASVFAWLSFGILGFLMTLSIFSSVVEFMIMKLVIPSCYSFSGCRARLCVVPGVGVFGHLSFLCVSLARGLSIW